MRWSRSEASRGSASTSRSTTIRRPRARSSDFAGFYERLRASEGGATTSQPSIGDFVAVYEPLLDAGQEIVSIHLSAGISGTFEAAGQARDRLSEEGKGGDRIRVVDSRSAAGGMGLCVVARRRRGRRRRRAATPWSPGPSRRGRS